MTAVAKATPIDGLWGRSSLPTESDVLTYVNLTAHAADQGRLQAEPWMQHALQKFFGRCKNWSLRTHFNAGEKGAFLGEGVVLIGDCIHWLGR